MPGEDGFYWYRCHGGTAVVGYVIVDDLELRNCGGMMGTTHDLTPQWLVENDVEFWSARILDPTEAAR